MSKSACSGTSRLSKGALLSMMGDAPFKKPPMNDPPLSEQEKARIMAVVEDNGGNINRASVVLGITASSIRRRIESWNAPQNAPQREESTSPTRRFFERAKSPWSISSFDHRSREVCIEIRNPSTTTKFSYFAPHQRFPD